MSSFAALEVVPPRPAKDSDTGAGAATRGGGCRPSREPVTVVQAPGSAVGLAAAAQGSVGPGATAPVAPGALGPGR